MLMNALCKPSMGAPGYLTKILQAKNWLKVDEFEPIYPVYLLPILMKNGL